MIKVSNKKFIEVQDWDNLVSETYGKIYSFQQQDDCKSRGIEDISVPVIGSVCWSCGKPVKYHENGKPHWHCECGAAEPTNISV